MRHVIRDLQFALRTLARCPAVTAIAVLVLTLGIGMPTMMFTVLNGVFREPPVPDPERLVRVVRTHSEQGGQRWDVSHHDYADWRAQQTSFEDIAAFAREDVTLSSGDTRPQRRNAAFVTPNAFDLLGVRPVLGRAFLPEDVRPGATPVAIVDYGVWQSRFARDSNVLGSVLSVDGTPHSLIGVMPDRFGFPANEQVWVPLALSLDAPRADSEDLQVFGRLNAGVSLEQASVEMRTIAARLAETYPETNREISADVVPYGEGLIDTRLTRGLYTMLAAVSFVLVIACVNVANLFLARTVGRGREVAVRTALGATRGRVVSLFLIESFAVAVAGGVLGTLVAWHGVRRLNESLVTVVGVAWVDMRIDGAVVGFVLAVVLLACLIASVLPVLQASRLNVSAALKDAPRGTLSSGNRFARFGRGLVIVQIALSCALLVVAGHLIKGVLELRAVDFGMPVDEIVTGEVELPRRAYGTTASRVRFFEELETLTATIPGVQAATLMSDLPGTVGYRAPVWVEGRPRGEEPTPRVALLSATPGFLNVLGSSVTEGRGFASQDGDDALPVVMVNQRFVSQFLPNERPVGRTVMVAGVQRTIVGVAPDLFMGNMREPDANGPGVYLPYAQSANVSMQLLVRTGQDPTSVVLQVREALESLDPSLALMNVDRLDRLMAQETVIFAIFGRLFLFFGLVALLLAAIGLYGTMTFTVRQRTPEWGLRMALGATTSSVVRLAATRVAAQVVIGLVAGLVIAGMLSYPLASFFYRVEPWDATIFAWIAVTLSVTAILAGLAPVRHATKIDPLKAWQDE